MDYLTFTCGAPFQLSHGAFLIEAYGAGVAWKGKGITALGEVTFSQEALQRNPVTGIRGTEM